MDSRQYPLLLSACRMTIGPPRDHQPDRRRDKATQREAIRARFSDRTDELGQRVSRSTISEIETGRRKSITVTDLILLAAALNTTPVALVYPGPYMEPTRFTPNQEVPEIWAAQWFSGLHRSVSHLPFAEGAETLEVSDLRNTPLT